MCDGSPGVENERIVKTPIVKLRSSRETPRLCRETPHSDARLRPSDRDTKTIINHSLLGSRTLSKFLSKIT